MFVRPKIPASHERRRYVRMPTVFPVEIFVPDDSGQKDHGQHLQAFTQDVSAGGMCLEIKIFGKHFEQFLGSPSTRLGLTINPAFSKNPIQASAQVAWFSKKENPPRYLVGVSYTEIEARARGRLIHYAQWLLWLPRILWAAGILMLALLAGLFAHNQTLIRENHKLVSQIVESASKKSAIASQLYELQKRKTVLEEENQKANKKIRRLESSMAFLTEPRSGRQNRYQKQLADILLKTKTVSQEIRSIQSDRQKLQSSYKALEEKEKPVTASLLGTMYGWIGSHQDFHTGLVASFEGDASLKDIAFTYDQSLAAQAFILFGDFKNAAAILSFFNERAALSEGGFFNAYDTVDGRSTENSVNVGPNVWIGIAALQYEHRVSASAKADPSSGGEGGKGRFLPLARRIGDWALGFQDEEGGLPGGPTVDWYSTEHNLDAYAFFRMLYEETHDIRFENARSRSLEWIKKYAYSSIQKRMQRGKGDSTIATDTFSWALAAVGPSTLEAIGFDPEAIMEFAENNCAVTVNFTQGDDNKSIQVKGFDFSKAKNIGRGGVVSTEWTAQMIAAYRILSKYFAVLNSLDKAELYSDKATFYSNELQKMIITSPSKTGQGRGCLPYASLDDADTGHGWRSPKGQKTGSVAGTAYGIFAWSDYNPFELESAKDKPR